MKRGGIRAGAIGWDDEKNYVQLMGRVGAGHVRHLMGQLRTEAITAREVATEVGVSERRVRQLYHGYLQACADGRTDEWGPGKSGGNRQRQIPDSVEALWRKMLTVRPAAPYAFCASEALRLHQFHTDRATVRRWALQQGCAHAGPPKKTSSGPIRRWQCAELGALWQLDATPHHWFGQEDRLYPLLGMVDDCSRVIVGARLYPRECLLAYMDFLPRAFESMGCLWLYTWTTAASSPRSPTA